MSYPQFLAFVTALVFLTIVILSTHLFVTRKPYKRHTMITLHLQATSNNHETTLFDQEES